MAHAAKRAAAALALCLWLAGCAPVSCSHTAEILKSSGEVQLAASEIKARAGAIAEEATSPEPDLPQIAKHAAEIHSAANSIISETESIAVHAGNVQDTENQWVRMIRYGAVAVAIAALCFLSWYWGVGSLTRTLFKRLGWWVDSAEEKRKSELKLAHEVLTGAATPKELVAVMRADPKSNRIYEATKGQ